MGFVKITKEGIVGKLKVVGLQKGDIVYVASFMPVLGNSSTLLEDTIEALIDVVGGGGTVVMPAFNWDYCSGDVFDPIKTPSKVGVLTEAFRKYSGALRSVTPYERNIQSVQCGSMEFSLLIKNRHVHR